MEGNQIRIDDWTDLNSKPPAIISCEITTCLWNLKLSVYGILLLLSSVLETNMIEKQPSNIKKDDCVTIKYIMPITGKALIDNKLQDII